MKIKIIIGVIILLICGVSLANVIIGNTIAEEVESELRSSIAEANLPIIIVFSEVTVNPIFAEVVIKDIIIADGQNTAKFNCDAFSASISYTEALRLASADEIEELNSFQLSLDNLIFNDLSKENKVSCENVSLDFDGHLTLNIIENLTKQFPIEKQKMGLSIRNLAIDFPNGFSEVISTPEQQNQISKIDEMNFMLSFLPDSKEFLIETMSLSTPLLSSDNSGRFKYTGSSMYDFKLEQIELISNISLDPSDTKWGLSDVTGRYGFSKLSSSLQVTVDFNKMGKPQIPKGEFVFALKDFSAEFSGRLKKEMEMMGVSSLLGVNQDEFKLEKFTVFLKKEMNQLTIKDTELLSPLLKATLDGVLLVDDSQPINTIIDNGKLVIKDMSPDLQLAIAKIEKNMRLSLPRVGDDIVLEFEGKLKRPKIKGLDL